MTGVQTCALPISLYSAGERLQLARQNIGRCIQTWRLELDKHKLSDHDRSLLQFIVHQLERNGNSWGGNRNGASTTRKHEFTPFCHVVIDEAQDFAICELKVLSDLTTGSGKTAPSVTLAGDLRQRVHASNSLGGWEELGINFERAPSFEYTYRAQPSLVTITRSYVKEIFLEDPDFKAPPGEETDKENRLHYWLSDNHCDGRMVSECIRDFRKGYPTAAATVAIVSIGDGSLTDWEEAIIKHQGNSFQTRISKGGQLVETDVVHVTDPREAKGLEFDAVVIVGNCKPRNSKSNAPIWKERLLFREFYVALTRARLSVFVVIDPEWPSNLQAWVTKRGVKVVSQSPKAKPESTHPAPKAIQTTTPGKSAPRNIRHSVFGVPENQTLVTMLSNAGLTFTDHRNSQPPGMLTVHGPQEQVERKLTELGIKLNFQYVDDMGWSTFTPY